MFLELLIASSVLAAHCPTWSISHPQWPLFSTVLCSFLSSSCDTHLTSFLTIQRHANGWNSYMMWIFMEFFHDPQSRAKYLFEIEISWTKPLKVLHMLLQHRHRNLYVSDLHSCLSRNETSKYHEFSHSVHSFSKWNNFQVVDRTFFTKNILSNERLLVKIGTVLPWKTQDSPIFRQNMILLFRQPDILQEQTRLYNAGASNSVD